jgi:hypothetical protein
MTAVLPMVLNLFVALTGPHDTAIYVAPSQVVAIIGSPGVGACPTTLITSPSITASRSAGGRLSPETTVIRSMRHIPDEPATKAT